MSPSQPLAAFTWSEAQVGARALSPVGHPAKLLGGVMAAADAGIIILSSLGAHLFRHGDLELPYGVTALTLLAALLTFNAMRVAGSYTRHVTSDLPTQIGRALQGWTAVLVTLVILVYLTKTSDDFSRGWIIGWYASVLVGLALVRMAAAAKVRGWRRRGKLTRTVAVVDLTEQGEEFARRMLRDSKGEMHLVGVFSPQATPTHSSGITDLLALSRLFRIDEVIVAVSDKSHSQADAIIRKLGTIPANVRLCPNIPELAIAPREADLLFGRPVLTLYRQPLIGWNRVVKRTEDLVLSLVGLVLAAPLMVAVAIAIKFDSPGPVLFRQQRHGFNGNIITVYKFRTMVHQLIPDVEVRQAQRQDSRVTRIGRLLRKSSIDELPQLFNVVQGGMSLVGPRPHALTHNDQYATLIDDYLGRHRVQPGITGWAQVNGLRGETETLDKMQRRLDHDLAYIDNWSLFLDLRILFMTVLLTTFDRNAY